MIGVDFFAILFILVLVCLIWFVFDSMRAREIATELARTYCDNRGVQFLDGSAALRSIRLVRRATALPVQRRFQFEYTEAGESRNRGTIIVTGSTVEQFLLQ